MMLKEATVYGFGKWQDFSISFQTEEINLLTGRNEAGKSTLQQFFLFMLFGLPPKKREFYQPKTGGPMGGQLVLQSNQYGTVFIERIHDIRNGEALCRFENGEEAGEEVLEALLSGLNRSVYESIFTFNAEDLIQLRSLTGRELGEVLLNIGLTGTQNIYRTENWLMKKEEELFKPKGKNPEINQQLTIVESLAKRLKEAEAEEDEYRALLNKKEEQSERLENVHQRIELIRKEIYNHSQVIKAVPLLEEYHQLIQNQPEGPLIDFPPKGKERLEQLNHSILPLESEARVISSQKQQTAEALAKLSHSSEYTGERSAEELLNSKQIFDQTKIQLHQLQQRKAKEQQQLKSALELMDVPVNEEELADYRFPFYIEETWRSIKQTQDSLNYESERMTEEQERLNRKKQRISIEMGEIEQKLLSENEKTEFNRKLADWESSQSSVLTEEAINQWNELLLNRRRGRNLWQLAALLIFTAGLTLSIYLSQWPVLAIGTLISAGLFYFGLSMKRSANKLESWLHSKQQEGGAVQEDEYSLHAIRQALSENQKREAERKSLETQLKQLNQEEILLEEKKKHLLQLNRRHFQMIHEQEQLYPFLSGLDLAYWEKLYHLITKTKEMKDSLKEIEDEEKNLEQTMDKIEAEVKKFLSDVNWEWNEKSIEEMLQTSIDWLDSMEKQKVKIEALKQELEHQQNSYDDIQEKLKPYEEKRIQLFETAQVNNEEEFYSKASLYEEECALRKRKEELKNQIFHFLSQEEQQDFQVWKTAPSTSALRYELEQKEEQLQADEKERESLREELADIKNSVMRLENSEKHSEYLHLFELEKSKLNELAREWAVHRMSLKLLKESKQKYQKKYFPRVIELAQEFFMKVTSARYVKLYLDKDQSNLQVKNSLGQVFNASELSRGTSDQLYVSLRFAVGKVMAERTGLPFVLDDAFVHFDEQRLKVMLELLQTMTASHQIILFSWREDLSELMQSSHSQTLK
ncbi:AAA family ATPase [Halobacillus rhizosphaerae]|uniref:ATP-binding protein n=1 Tax=Halobacillus rhizosphaerae TaxID=3064889 RepID=UPI00398BB99D